MTCRYSNTLHLLPILLHRRTHFHFHPYVTQPPSSPSSPLRHHHPASNNLTSTITDIARSRITLALRRHVGPRILQSFHLSVPSNKYIIRFLMETIYSEVQCLVYYRPPSVIHCLYLKDLTYHQIWPTLNLQNSLEAMKCGGLASQHKHKLQTPPPVLTIPFHWIVHHIEISFSYYTTFTLLGKMNCIIGAVLQSTTNPRPTRRNFNWHHHFSSTSLMSYLCTQIILWVSTIPWQVGRARRKLGALSDIFGLR